MPTPAWACHRTMTDTQLYFSIMPDWEQIAFAAGDTTGITVIVGWKRKMRRFRYLM